MSLRRVYLIIIFVLNYTCKSNSTEKISDIMKESQPFQKLLSLPKKIGFTIDNIVKNTGNYLKGLQNEDVYLNGTQLIEKYGYKVEQHHVVTSDGYNLALYRMPGEGRVVFLMHGLLSSFVDWLTAGPDQGLAYLLAARGYDVWMGNARGNTFSRQHIRMSPSDPKFWEFSFNEIGSEDLPAMIDYVLMKTGKKKLTYIGQSQGTTTFFVLCSTKPEYNDKIDLMVALSAVAWMKHANSPIIQIAAQHHAILFPLAKSLGLNEVAPDNNLKKALTLIFCGDTFLASAICGNLMFLFCGFDYEQINFEQAPVIFSHLPAGSSLLQINHYLQLVTSGYFRKYDYGAEENLKKYNSTVPPSYPVNEITAPVAIFHSRGDWLASTKDVNNLRNKLKNIVDYYVVPLRQFNHADFMYAKDVKSLVYDRVLNLIKENSKYSSHR